MDACHGVCLYFKDILFSRNGLDGLKCHRMPLMFFMCVSLHRDIDDTNSLTSESCETLLQLSWKYSIILINIML